MRNLILAAALALSTSVMADTWTYDDETDKMGDRRRYASLASDNVLNQKFPYNSGPAILMIFKSKNGTRLSVSAGDEPMVCGYNCTMRVRFDGAAPEVFQAEAHKSLLFVRSPKALAMVKKAKKIVVEVELYRSGVQILEFSVENELKEF